MAQQRYHVAQMIEAAHGSRGIKARIARSLGCDWDTVNYYARRYPSFAAALEAERQQLVDQAEHGLAERVAEGDWQAITYTLSTLGRDRGYGQKIEQSISGDVRVIVEYVDHGASE